MQQDQYTLDDFLLDDSFLAYCRGDDPAAVAFWETWQQRQPPNLRVFREAEQEARLLGGQKPRLDAALAELEQLLDRADADRPAPAPAEDGRVVPLRSADNGRSLRSVTRFGAGRTRWLVAAAVTTLLLGFGGYWRWRQQPVTYQTAYGEQQRITLPDGSVVTLNSHSTLTHARHWPTGQPRTVTLSGEGYFSVVHTAEHRPFRVELNGPFAVQVLGTAFSAVSRPTTYRVVLNEGRVAVQFRDQRPALRLRPGELVEMDTLSSAVRRRLVNPAHYNAWLRNQLVFESADVAEVLRTIEHQFGVRVRVADTSLVHRRFTGILPMTSPDQVLRAFAELNELTVNKKDDEYVLVKP